VLSKLCVIDPQEVLPVRLDRELAGACSGRVRPAPPAVQEVNDLLSPVLHDPGD
jgi:hypothetical protein